jgi:hypothetical protein
MGVAFGVLTNPIVVASRFKVFWLKGRSDQRPKRTGDRCPIESVTSFDLKSVVASWISGDVVANGFHHSHTI